MRPKFCVWRSFDVWRKIGRRIKLKRLGKTPSTPTNAQSGWFQNCHVLQTESCRHKKVQASKHVIFSKLAQFSGNSKKIFYKTTLVFSFNLHSKPH